MSNATRQITSIRPASPHHIACNSPRGAAEPDERDPTINLGPYAGKCLTNPAYLFRSTYTLQPIDPFSPRHRFNNWSLTL